MNKKTPSMAAWITVDSLKWYKIQAPTATCTAVKKCACDVETAPRAMNFPKLNWDLGCLMPSLCDRDAWEGFVDTSV